MSGGAYEWHRWVATHICHSYAPCVTHICHPYAYEWRSYACTYIRVTHTHICHSCAYEWRSYVSTYIWVTHTHICHSYAYEWRIWLDGTYEWVILHILKQINHILHALCVHVNETIEKCIWRTYMSVTHMIVWMTLMNESYCAYTYTQVISHLWGRLLQMIGLFCGISSLL